MGAYPDYGPINPFTCAWKSISEDYKDSDEFFDLINQSLTIFNAWFNKPENEGLKWEWVQHVIAEDIVQRGWTDGHERFAYILGVNEIKDIYECEHKES